MVLPARPRPRPPALIQGFSPPESLAESVNLVVGAIEHQKQDRHGDNEDEQQAVLPQWTLIALAADRARSLVRNLLRRDWAVTGRC